MIPAAFGRPEIDRWVEALPVSLAVLLAAVVGAAAVTAFVLLLLARRGRRREAQEIVRLLEEMRSGRGRPRLDLDARSPLAAIAESANRLGQDLSVRWSRGEAAGEAFEALQEAARGYAVVTTDADGDLRTLSPGAAQMFGWEEDAVVARNASILFDDAAWKDLLPKLARKSLRERGVETRSLMVRKDGTRFPARLLVRLLRGHAEDHPGFLLVVQDISEQVRVETEMKNAEARARGVLEDLRDGVAVVQQGRVVLANAAFRTLADVPERAGPGWSLLDRVATADVLFVRDAMADLEGGAKTEAHDAIVRLRDASGRESIEARWVAVPHTFDGRPAVLVTMRDETALRRTLRALSAQEARLDAALDAWDDGVLVVETEAAGPRVRLVNRALLDLIGLTRGEVAGVSAAELARALRARGEEGAAAAACLEDAEDGPAHATVHAEGRVLALRAAPFGSPGAPARGRVLAVRDATQDAAALRARTEDAELWRRRHETAEAAAAKLRALQDDLEARRVEAERLNQELRTLDTMKSDLLANVSHELQTPLVSIRGYTEMILKGRLGTINDEQKQGLTLSLRNIDRLIAMIDNLLAFARMDREATSLAVEIFPLAPVVEEAVALLRERIEAKGLNVAVRLADPEAAVRADRDKILQVFVNLLSNAVKFNRDGGSIEVDVRAGKPGFVLVQVKDSGVGIAKDDLEKIFDRFYQVDDRGPRTKDGTGIGLAIVRNILRSHGCVIHAASVPGEGATFSFTLPLAGATAAAAGPSAPPEPNRDAAPSTTPPSPAPAAEERPAPAAQPDASPRPRLRIIRRG